MPSLCHILRLIRSLQNFTAAILINGTDTFARDNFALQVHDVDESAMTILPLVFVANLGDIDQLQVAGRRRSITEDNLQTFENKPDFGNQLTAFSSLPRNVFNESAISGNDTLRVGYTVFLDDVLFQLRSMSELAETYRGFGTGSIIISARIGSGPPPENITDPRAMFFFEVCYISLRTN